MSSPKSFGKQWKGPSGWPFDESRKQRCPYCSNEFLEGIPDHVCQTQGSKDLTGNLRGLYLQAGGEPNAAAEAKHKIESMPKGEGKWFAFLIAVQDLGNNN